MKATSRLVWSATAKRIPDSINSKLVGTFPSIVQGDDGSTTCAFFVRAAKEEFNLMCSGSATCLVRPQFVKTPHGPLVVAYCMAAPKDAEGSQPFFSETAIFPRLASMPAHREFAELLQSRSEVYLVVCDENGACIFNSKAGILEQWRAELAEKAKAFDEGKQIIDERTAIISLYWYQERYNPSSRIFEVSH